MLGETISHLVPSQGGVPIAFQPQFDVDTMAGLGQVAAWSPDGRFVLFSGMHSNDPKSRDRWVAPAGGGEPVPTGALAAVPATLQRAVFGPCVSADDRWVALLVGKPPGSLVIYIVPVRDPMVPEQQWISVAEDVRLQPDRKYLDHAPQSVKARRQGRGRRGQGLRLGTEFQIPHSKLRIVSRLGIWNSAAGP